MFIYTLSLLSLAANKLIPPITDGNGWLYNAPMIFVPLLMAYLIYNTACNDRLRGLLAAVPLVAIIWTVLLEFVPALQKSLAYGWMFIIAFAATVMILRTKHFSVALGLVMAIPILGGLPYAYLGVYQGGTLPFSQPGPSLQEAFRQYVPFLAMVLTIVLGPQLAVKLRGIGLESTKAGGKIFYRLALAGYC